MVLKKGSEMIWFTFLKDHSGCFVQKTLKGGKGTRKKAGSLLVVVARLLHDPDETQPARSPPVPHLCTFFFSLSYFYLFFNWGIVVSQCCVSFHRTAKWSSLCYTADSH